MRPLLTAIGAYNWETLASQCLGYSNLYTLISGGVQSRQVLCKQRATVAFILDKCGRRERWTLDFGLWTLYGGQLGRHTLRMGADLSRVENPAVA